jgi:hypothetical protein
MRRELLALIRVTLPHLRAGLIMEWAEVAAALEFYGTDAQDDPRFRERYLSAVNLGRGHDLAAFLRALFRLEIVECFAQRRAQHQ